MKNIVTIMGNNMINSNYNCDCKKCKTKINKCDCGSCKVTKKNKRRIWVRPYYTDRNNSGAFQTVFSALTNTDPSIFHNYMRMSPSMFEELLLMVGPSIQKIHFLREPISAKQRLAITIR